MTGAPMITVDVKPAEQPSLSHWVGTPYTGERFCRVLVSIVLGEWGMQLPATDNPQQAQGWSRVDRPGFLDVVVFNLAGKPGHVGVCDGRGGFLHCEEGKRAAIERLSSPLWGSRIEGFYRCTR